MGSRGDFAKKQAKKPKQSQGSSGNQSSFSSKPVFVMPQIIKKDKKDE